ncbi:MAG: mannose-1-phosphate guanylyltransferase/mannose-6-phosphate isomerase [Nitrospirae bacterium]|nr:mannose-1-phosphate guanylyltransferase/mannose-6-phosphate isomerase [Nitrospirota bacterium]
MKALILAGGQGTRFWPLSRELYPKQLLRIGGGHTLLQETALRLGPMIKPADVHVITNGKLLLDIKGQLADAGIAGPEKNIMLEPVPRNTAPAVGLGALYLGIDDPESVIAVLPSDHLIKEKAKFHAVLRKAAKLAEAGYLVVFGIRPTRPETGYGYIKLGDTIDKAGFKVEKFVEKPDAETAEKYVASGEYLWNSGMFVWRADVVLAEIKKHMPELSKSLGRIGKAIGTPREAAVLDKEFSAVKAISIDYGVMERSKNVAVIVADFSWSDLGSWDAIGEVIPPDADGNVSVGKVVNVGCKGSTFYAEDRLVAAVGLEDVIIVDTPDATLVCRKDRAQDVKEVVAELKRRGYDEHITHKTVKRPWGSYTVLQEGPMYKIKRIEVKPGAKLSHQMHHHRSEHWVVVAGTARVTNGDLVTNVHVNESTYIPMSTRHRLENPGKVPLQIIEVQNGEYLKEDDIVRFDDVYRRP